MKEMIKARQEQMQKRGKKGFTLMEMLIVVAIIAILIAIAIPAFMAQLNKAKAETDTANIRSGYAAALTAGATSGATADTTYFLKKDGSVASTVSTGTTGDAYECSGSAADATGDVGGVTQAASIGFTPGSIIRYVYHPATNSVEILTGTGA